MLSGCKVGERGLALLIASITWRAARGCALRSHLTPQQRPSHWHSNHPIPSLISHFLTHPFFKNICRVVTKTSGNKRKRKLKGYKTFIWIPRCPEPSPWKLGGQRKGIKNQTNPILLCCRQTKVPSPPRYRGKPKNGNISAPKKCKTKAKQLDQNLGNY